MPRPRKRMSWVDRLMIEKLYNSNYSYRQIASQLGYAVSSIYAEVQRGLYPHLGLEYTRRPMRYSAELGEKASVLAATSRGPGIKLGHRYDYANYVSRQIHGGFSPDAIVGELRRDGKWTVSTVTLYRYIDQGYIPDVTNKNLWLKPRKKRPYRKLQKAARAPKGTSIERRPETIGDRGYPGHWEMDTVIGQSRGKKQALLVLTERHTRFEIIQKLPDKTAKSVVHTLDRLLRKYPKGTFNTITVDNGSEFQDCYRMEHDVRGNRRLDVYYCHPYSSWERGSNENANKIIRRYLPKGQSLEGCTQKQCDSIANYMNTLPRRILNYATAQELFAQFLESL